MIFFSHNLKIGYIVIARVFVDMVNHLFAIKVPSNVGFHDKAMLHYIPFGVSVWVFGNSPSKISVFGSIRNKLSFKDHTDTSFVPAIEAAIFLRSLSRARDVVSTPKALILWRFTPAISCVALTRTKFGCILPAIMRMKTGFAMFARNGFCFISHGFIIAEINEKYCESAAKRLEQGVLF